VGVGGVGGGGGIFVCACVYAWEYMELWGGYG